MQASGPKGLLETVGRTHLLRLTRVLGRHHAAVLVKAENRNPLGSVKDRIGLAMIEAAEADGAIEPGGRIIEPTSGNTGIALAFVAAAKGYAVTLTMPDSMSTERRALLLGLGADFILTPAKVGMRGAIERAEELLAATRGGWMPRQFENPANPAIHEETTGPEIWAATAGQVDIIVACVGTGGTITGVSRFLKMRNPNVRSIAVEPAESAVLSGHVRLQHRRTVSLHAAVSTDRDVRPAAGGRLRLVDRGEQAQAAANRRRPRRTGAPTTAREPPLRGPATFHVVRLKG